MYAGTCSGNVLLMILQYIPGSSGWLMVSWCYWVSHKPCLPPWRECFVLFFWEGLVLFEVLGLSGWGGEGQEEVEDGLTLAPRPPGWLSGAPAAGTWTFAWSPRSTWGMRRGSGRPSARGVVGWLDEPVGGSRSPGEEPLASEAGPANHRKASEWEEAGKASAARCAACREKQKRIKERTLNEKISWGDDGGRQIMVRNVRLQSFSKETELQFFVRNEPKSNWCKAHKKTQNKYRQCCWWV